MVRELIQSLSLRESDPVRNAFIKNAYAEWDKWNSLIFDDVFQEHDIPIILFKPFISSAKTSAGKSQSLAKCEKLSPDLREELTNSGFKPVRSDDAYEGFPPMYTLCQYTLAGSNQILRAGDEFRTGRYKFMLDVVLHETTHHYDLLKHGSCEPPLSNREEEYINGPLRDPYWLNVRREHSKVYSKICNKVARKLNLPVVAYFFDQRAHNRHQDRSCVSFPHGLRKIVKEYYGTDKYQGAVLDPGAWSAKI